MKAILEFYLPEDDQEFEQCSKASDMAYVLWEFGNNVKRSLIKHQDVSEEFENGVNAVFDKFYELLEDGKINLDKIMS